MPDASSPVSRFSLSLLDSIASMIIILDQQGRIVAYNKACRDLSGLQLDEVKGKSAAQLFLLPEEGIDFQAMLGKFIQDKLTISYKNFVRNIKGELRWIEWTCSVLPGENGDSDLVIATGVDVTEFAAEVRIMQQNQQQFASLFHESPVGICILSYEDWTLIDFNPAFSAMIGYSREELIGKDLKNQSVFEMGASDLEFLRKLRRTGQAAQAEIYLNTKSGRRLYVIASIVLVKLDGKDCLLASFQDISDRKLFEEEILKLNQVLEKRIEQRTLDLEEQVRQREVSEIRYRTLAETARDFIFVISRDGLIDYVNNYACQFFKLKPEDMIHQPRDKFFPEKTSAHQKANLAIVIEEDRESYFENMTPFPGGVLWLGTRLVPIHDKDGNVVSVLGVSRDISEKKRAEEELANAYRRQIELNDLQANFVSMVTHQYSTPLTTILSSAELLEHHGDSWTPEKRLFHLQRIQNHAKKLDLLVKDMMDLQRVEIASRNIEADCVNLVEFCDRLVEEVKQADEGKHSIVFNACSNCDVCFLDEKLLYQVLENLLSNAVKYSPDQSSIQLTLARENQFVCFVVEDRGIGIPAADLKLLFTPFHRGQNVTNISGTGLGLLLVKKSVDLMEGSIEIQSQENFGTTVYIKLPYRPVGATG